MLRTKSATSIVAHVATPTVDASCVKGLFAGFHLQISQHTPGEGRSIEKNGAQLPYLVSTQRNSQWNLTRNKAPPRRYTALFGETSDVQLNSLSAPSANARGMWHYPRLTA